MPQRCRAAASELFIFCFNTTPYLTSPGARGKITFSSPALQAMSAALVSALPTTTPLPDTPPPAHLLYLPTDLLVRVVSRCDPLDIARVAAVSLLFHASLAEDAIRLWAQERGFELLALPEGEGCAVWWLCVAALLRESNPPARAAAAGGTASSSTAWGGSRRVDLALVVVCGPGGCFGSGTTDEPRHGRPPHTAAPRRTRRLRACCSLCRPRAVSCRCACVSAALKIPYEWSRLPGGQAQARARHTGAYTHREVHAQARHES